MTSVRCLLAQVYVQSQKGEPRHNPDYPFVVCQVWKPKDLEPPFQVDVTLKKALRATVEQFTRDWVEESITLEPTVEFLTVLNRHYRALASKGRTRLA